MINKNIRFLGLISAGKCKTLEKNNINTLPVDIALLPKNIRNLYIGKVFGSSMSHENINQGEYVLLKKTKTLKNNNIVVIENNSNQKFLRTFITETDKTIKTEIEGRKSFLRKGNIINTYIYLNKVKIDKLPQTKKRIKAMSLFTSAGIDEYFLSRIGIDVVVANELLQDRANLYKSLYRKSNMICGDVLDPKIYKTLISSAKREKVDLIIATPPCQGVSLIGKNKTNKQMSSDKRNHLIFALIAIVKKIGASYVIIENVPRFLDLLLPYKGKLTNIIDILYKELGLKYNIEYRMLNVKDYGVPQNRKRAVIKLYKKGLKWAWPKEEREITLREAIGHLPSIEAGEDSGIKWHVARKHSRENVLWMQYTPEGKSAFQNKVYSPKKIDGKKIKAFAACYSRMKWDKPCPTITMRNDCIASQRNVHPGRKRQDGTYSDARVLTLLELFVLSSFPQTNKIPPNTPEMLIRRCIGEGVPPLFMKKICQKMGK